MSSNETWICTSCKKQHANVRTADACCDGRSTKAQKPAETWLCTSCSKRHATKASADFCHPLPGSDDGYDVLRRVLARAVEQASAGKGRERHAHDEPFDQQKIVLLAKWSGGPAFDVGQACKKALESTRLPKDRAVAELLGAINYLAAAVILLEQGPDEPSLTEQVSDLIAKGRQQIAKGQEASW